MYSKNIIINLERTTIGTVDVSKQHQRGFEVMALFAAVLAKYVITHYTEFEHLTKFAGPVKSEKVHSDNINTLQKRIISGEIRIDVPVDLSSEGFSALKRKCFKSVMDTAVRCAAEYWYLMSAYNGSGKTYPKPHIPEQEDCSFFALKLQKVKQLIQLKEMEFPFLDRGEFYTRKIRFVPDADGKNFDNATDLNSGFIVGRDGIITVESMPKRFVKKQNNYSLHDIIVMGVDLGTINDASCAIYNNQTGKVTGSIVQIPEKTEIKKLQSDYKRADAKTRMELELRINDLKRLYCKRLAEAICKLALDHRVEFVFFEGLFDEHYNEDVLTLWNPRAVLETVYHMLHNAGVCYKNISPANTSRLYSNGGLVDRLESDRSKAIAPDGNLINADENAALNILARGLVDMYFDTIPDNILLSIFGMNTRLLQCNEIIFADLLSVRKYVDLRCDTSVIFQKQRDFRKIKNH